MRRDELKRLWPALTDYVNDKFGWQYKDQVGFVNDVLRGQDYYRPGLELNENKMKQMRRGSSTPGEYHIDALLVAVEKHFGEKIILSELPNTPIKRITNNEMAALEAENRMLRERILRLEKEMEARLNEKESHYKERVEEKALMVNELKEQLYRSQRIIDKLTDGPRKD